MKPNNNFLFVNFLVTKQYHLNVIFPIKNFNEKHS